MAEHESDGGRDLDFDRLMAQMGVRRLPGDAAAQGPAAPARGDEKGRGKRRRRARTAEREQAPGGSASDEPTEASPEPSDEPELEEEPPAEAQGEVQGEAPVGPTDEECDELLARLHHLEEEVQLLAGERDQLVATLERERVEAAQQLRSEQDGDRSSLAQVFGERGVKGIDEAAFLVRALAQARLVQALLALLEPTDAVTLRRFLEDRVSLSCGDPACAPPSGRAMLVVPKARCEVCGGVDLPRAVRRFVDGCLVHALTRVGIAGGSPVAHRQLRDLVHHRSIKLRLLPGDPERVLPGLAPEADQLDLLVTWGPRRPVVPWVDESRAASREGGAEAPRRTRAIRHLHLDDPIVARALEQAGDALLAADR